MRVLPWLLWLLWLVACSGSVTGKGADGTDGADGTEGTDSADGTDDADGTDGSDGADLSTGIVEVEVTVTMDGVPAEGVDLWQGGTTRHVVTDATGRAVFPVDFDLEADIVVMSTYATARIGVLDLTYGVGSSTTIEMTTFVDEDNPDYEFQHPGTPDIFSDSGFCSHCHITMSRDWYVSPHSTSASNPWLHDLYAGTANTLATQSVCEGAGGTWATGTGPGTGTSASRCYLGDGVLPALNECGVACDTAPAAQPERGECADCHAPGIDGPAGGRGLLEATGIAYDYGVHCDVCHKIEDVDLDAPDPGIAGRLRLMRPIEDEGLIGMPWTPITFGPFPDVGNPRMGSVVRDHFANGELCAGCHEYWQEVAVPGASIDTDRWPDGRLPIHTTWSELEAGALGTDVPCQSCHMPPDGDVGNAADLGNELTIAPGLAAGWWRPAGAVRRHVWFGPRSDEQRMIDLAGRVQVLAEFVGDVLVADVTTMNTGPGHALPTGEPLRSVMVQVAARCGSTIQPAVGGDVLPAWAGALDQQDAAGDWRRWPDATIGETIVVVEIDGWHDYAGPLVFGDGTFTPEQRGLPVETLAGVATITGVSGDVVTLDATLPIGDVAYRVPAAELVDEDDVAAPLAGSPGFAFARVLTDAGGAAMVPHFMAVDVQSDNRLMPGEEWTSSHRFEVGCDDPMVEARLLHRPAPWSLGSLKRWDNRDAVMATDQVEVTR